MMLHWKVRTVEGAQKLVDVVRLRLVVDGHQVTSVHVVTFCLH